MVKVLRCTQILYLCGVVAKKGLITPFTAETIPRWLQQNNNRSTYHLLLSGRSLELRISTIATVVVHSLKTGTCHNISNKSRVAGNVC